MFKCLNVLNVLKVTIRASLLNNCLRILLVALDKQVLT